MCRKQTFKIVFGLKVPLMPQTAVWTFSFHFLSSPLLSLFLRHFFSFLGAVYKSETGQRDGGIGMHVWGLENWGRETRDLRTSRMGRRDVWDGDRGSEIQGRGM